MRYALLLLMVLSCSQANAATLFDDLFDIAGTDLFEIGADNLFTIDETPTPTPGPRYGRVWVAYMRMDDLINLSMDQLNRMAVSHDDTKPTAIHFHRSQQER